MTGVSRGGFRQQVRDYDFGGRLNNVDLYLRAKIDEVPRSDDHYPTRAWGTWCCHQDGTVWPRWTLLRQLAVGVSVVVVIAAANLLSNVRVNSPAGAPVTTSIATATEDDSTTYLEPAVVDDGPGINPEVIPHLSGRFVRTDKIRSDKAGIFGMRLTIAASMI